MFGIADPKTVALNLAREKARAVADQASSLVLHATRALGRELAEGFLERRPEIVESVRDVAGTLGESFTASAVKEVTTEARKQLGHGDGPLARSLARTTERVTQASVRGLVEEAGVEAGGVEGVPPHEAPAPAPLDAAVRRLGRAAATGATEGIADRAFYRLALPFGAGILATLAFTMARGHGSGRRSR